MKLDEILEPRIAKAVRALVDTRRIARDIKRMKAVVNSKAEVAAKIRRDASTVFNLVFPPMAPTAEHDGVGPMDAMLRCPGGHWHKRENATTESRMNEQGALVQVVVCGHKVGK